MTTCCMREYVCMCVNCRRNAINEVGIKELSGKNGSNCLNYNWCYYQLTNEWKGE